MTVATRFRQLVANLTLTDEQKLRGAERRESVVRVLNTTYWGTANNTANSYYVGSWAKRTRIRPPRDVDVLFELPEAVHRRFQQRTGNRQSQLLQEVKGVLAASFLTTNIRGDGPVVIVPFSAYNVEVVPAFRLTNGRHWVCFTSAGGHYVEADYSAENAYISDSNQRTNNNTRELIKMTKRWQDFCSVPIKSFHIELLAVNFLNNWKYSGNSATYYDWMIRDFFEYCLRHCGGRVYAPGTHEAMNVGSAWESRVRTALERARKACAFEAASRGPEAGDEWQKIFGTDIPKYV